MAGGFLHGGSSGTASLNFKVVAYATEAALLAATPAGITIGVITETKITSWMFAFTEPADPEEGMVWFTIEKSGQASFNALKKNGIEIFPVSASQYISGAWQAVTAMTYQNDAWTEWWTGWFYENGEIWSGCEYSQSLTPSTASVTYEADHILLATAAGKTSEVYHVIGPVEIDRISAITVEGTHLEGNSNSSFTRVATVFVSKTQGDSYKNAEAIASQVQHTIAEGTAFSLELDTAALSGAYYIHAGVNTQGSSWTSVRKISIGRIKGEFSELAVLEAKAAAYDILTEGVIE